MKDILNYIIFVLIYTVLSGFVIYMLVSQFVTVYYVFNTWFLLVILLILVSADIWSILKIVKTKKDKKMA